MKGMGDMNNTTQMAMCNRQMVRLLMTGHKVDKNLLMFPYFTDAKV
jgi:hypothetical protein